MINDEELSQQLAALVAYEEKQWATEFQPPKLPQGAPSLARMYTAILREDWTKPEWDSMEDKQVQRMYHNTLESVWYPTFEQLTKYLDGKLPADLQNAVEHHLEVDKCLHSLRLLGWVRDLDTDDRPENVSMGHRPFEVSSMGEYAAAAPSAEKEPKTLIDDEQVRLIHDPQSSQFRMSSTVLGEGTLMRVVVLGAEGKQVWQRFILLWDKFRERAMGRCEAPKAGDDLNAESSKHNSPLCIPVDISQLKESDAATLEQSWLWSNENQSESVDAWKTFAMEMLQKSNVGLIKSVAQKIC